MILANPLIFRRATRNDGVNDSIATDAQACEIKPTWNVAACKGDVDRLNVGGGGFSGRGGAPRCATCSENQ
jgi:hypothetical protein